MLAKHILDTDIIHLFCSDHCSCMTEKATHNYLLSSSSKVEVDLKAFLLLNKDIKTCRTDQKNSSILSSLHVIICLHST